MFLKSRKHFSISFDAFAVDLIITSLDLRYKKLNCFLEGPKFLLNWGTRTELFGLKFLISGFLNARSYSTCSETILSYHIIC